MLKKYCAIIFVTIGLILVVFPKIDIVVANLFYKHGHGFIYKNHSAVSFVFKVVPIITMLWAFFCLLYILYIKFENPKKAILSNAAVYLLVAALFGPGLLVNYGLKEHVGRARPSQILEFGGNKSFSGPMRIAEECEHNCSFTSGHAAMGYYFSSLSYVLPGVYANIAFAFGILFGSVVGFGRMAQGGHFLSDVIFSGIFIMCVNHISFVLWKKLSPKHKTKGKSRAK